MNKKLILIIGGIVSGLIFLCLVVCVVSAALSNGSKTPAPTAQAQLAVSTGGETPAAKPTNTPKPTKTPKPTNTPKPTDTPKPTETPVILPGIGTPAASAGVVIQANKVTKTGGSNPYWKPKSGNTYLVVDIFVGNGRSEAIPYNPLYFKVRDSQGFEYNAGISTEEPSLKSGELAPKETVRGLVQFEVPADAEGFVMSYKPLVLFSDFQEIKVRLEE